MPGGFDKHVRSSIERKVMNIYLCERIVETLSNSAVRSLCAMGIFKPNMADVKMPDKIIR